MIRKRQYRVLAFAMMLFSCGSSNRAKRPLSSGQDLSLQSRLQPGETRGAFDLTFYWLAETSKQDKGHAQVNLFDKSCQLIEKVTPSFSKRLRMEGSGKLDDGRIVTAAGGCSCASKCYREVSSSEPWGMGVKNRPLKPFRSIAVDTKKIDIGETLYIAQLDGVKMGGNNTWDAFVHDGCVLADDVGHGVKGRQVDLFIASKSVFSNQFKKQNNKRTLIREGGERCRYLTH